MTDETFSNAKMMGLVFLILVVWGLSGFAVGRFLVWIVRRGDAVAAGMVTVFILCALVNRWWVLDGALRSEQAHRKKLELDLRQYQGRRHQ